MTHSSIKYRFRPLLTLAVTCTCILLSCSKGDLDEDKLHVEYIAGALHYTIPEGFFHDYNMVFLHLHSVDKHGKNVTIQKDFLLPDRHRHCSILTSKCPVQQKIPDTSTFHTLLTGIYSIECGTRLTQSSWDKKEWSEFDLYAH